MDREDLASLLERVEKAEGPDRELDHALLMLTKAGAMLRDYGYVRVDDGYVTDTPPVTGANKCTGPQPYTSSIDAALALLEEMLPGWDWSLHCDNGEAIAGIQPPSEEGCDTSDCVAATPALAVLSALLRALIAQKETTDGK